MHEMRKLELGRLHPLLQSPPLVFSGSLSSLITPLLFSFMISMHFCTQQTFFAGGSLTSLTSPAAPRPLPSYGPWSSLRNFALIDNETRLLRLLLAAEPCDSLHPGTDRRRDLDRILYLVPLTHLQCLSSSSLRRRLPPLRCGYSSPSPRKE